MALTLKQWTGENITPSDDGALYHHLEARSGFFTGVTMTHLGANQIQVTSGRGVICGRTFTVEQETINVELSETETTGMLVLKLDTSNTTTPLQFVSYTGSHELVKQDVNASGTVYEVRLASYTVSAIAISNIAFDYTVPDDLHIPAYPLKEISGTAAIIPTNTTSFLTVTNAATTISLGIPLANYTNEYRLSFVTPDNINNFSMTFIAPSGYTIIYDESAPTYVANSLYELSFAVAPNNKILCLFKEVAL